MNRHAPNVGLGHGSLCVKEPLAVERFESSVAAVPGNLNSILDLAGWPRIRLYDLRHSAATIVLAAGVSTRIISEQFGHASTAFTLDTHPDVLPHMQDEVAARLEAMLFRATA